VCWVSQRRSCAAEGRFGYDEAAAAYAAALLAKQGWKWRMRSRTRTRTRCQCQATLRTRPSRLNPTGLNREKPRCLRWDPAGADSCRRLPRLSNPSRRERTEHVRVSAQSLVLARALLAATGGVSLGGYRLSSSSRLQRRVSGFEWVVAKRWAG